MLKRDNQEPILGLRLVGDYILCFGSKWIDLRYVPPLPKAGEQLISECDPTSRTFHLQHGDVDFDSASLSEPQPNPKSPNNSRIVYILARRPTVGLFYFRITVYNPDYSPSGPRELGSRSTSLGRTSCADPRRELSVCLSCRSVQRGSAVSG